MLFEEGKENVREKDNERGKNVSVCVREREECVVVG